MPLNDRQSQYLDAWRGSSAIVVLIGHSFEILQPHPSPLWSDIGSGAVMIFFVLSGFFIRQSLDKCLARGRPGHFVAARVDRILPPFLFSLVLVVAICWIAPTRLRFGDPSSLSVIASRQLSLEHLLPTTLFLNGFFGDTVPANQPLWSLSFEVWYYALALLIALPRLRWAGLAVGVLLTWRNPIFALLGCVWVLGFFLPKLPRWLIILPLPAVLLALLFPGSPLNVPACQLAIGVAFAAHLANLPKHPPRLWIERSAGWSYTLYVIHFPLLLFACDLFGPSWLIPLAIVAVAALIAPWIEGIRLLSPAPQPHVA